MLITLYEIEQFFSKAESAQPKSCLIRRFGQSSFEEALMKGWIREFKMPCHSQNESLCWLTKTGREFVKQLPQKG